MLVFFCFKFSKLNLPNNHLSTSNSPSSFAKVTNYGLGKISSTSSAINFFSAALFGGLIKKALSGFNDFNLSLIIY
ncbi:hypothetical protein [Candidatus Methylopumilus turicensis]|uniref:hypothetical protein n=1 Tax=Candidatus Methylopumilus turicensis TaxID=1581680 RepID=UPI0005F28B65|nr:hypothetical protein [Candidatus Methylopumilus turicensis]